MDSRTFDSLTRSVVSDTTRRQACKVIAAGTLGVALTRLGLGATIAACKKATKKCDETSECCGDLVCRRANSQNYYDKTETRCCRRIGEHCNQGIECCGVDVICNGNFCQKA